MATKEKSTKQGSKTDRGGQSDKKQQGNPMERQSGQQSGQQTSQTGKSGNK